MQLRTRRSSARRWGLTIPGDPIPVAGEAGDSAPARGSRHVASERLGGSCLRPYPAGGGVCCCRVGWALPRRQGGVGGGCFAWRAGDSGGRESRRVGGSQCRHRWDGRDRGGFGACSGDALGDAASGVARGLRSVGWGGVLGADDSVHGGERGCGWRVRVGDAWVARDAFDARVWGDGAWVGRRGSALFPGAVAGERCEGGEAHRTALDGPGRGAARGGVGLLGAGRGDWSAGRGAGW